MVRGEFPNTVIGLGFIFSGAELSGVRLYTPRPQVWMVNYVINPPLSALPPMSQRAQPVSRNFQRARATRHGPPETEFQSQAAGGHSLCPCILMLWISETDFPFTSLGPLKEDSWLGRSFPRGAIKATMLLQTHRIYQG